MHDLKVTVLSDALAWMPANEEEPRPVLTRIHTRPVDPRLSGWDELMDRLERRRQAA